ncbi:MAG TPA: MFS transporter [Methylibium sp.]|nr:MFS transporter [Methylibium sp.]
MPRIDVLQLADDARFQRIHVVVFLWCFAIIVADGYDLAVAGVALPAIMQDMQVDPATAGFMASSALFGMMFGAILLGTLADRIGRRVSLAACVTLFSLFTMAAGLMREPVSFSVMRFIAGLGIGGALPCIAAQMTEYAPKQLRGVLFTAMGCGVAVGSVVATLVGKLLLESHGWPSVFLAAALPLAMVPFMLRWMPESMPFLLRRGDDAALRQIAARLAPGRPLPADARFVLPDAQRLDDATVGKLFLDGRGFSTLMFWLVFFLGLFMTYALSTWLVKLMAMAGHSLGSALNFLLIFNGGAIAGAIGGGWLADRLHIKWVLCAFFAVSSVALTLLGHGVQPLPLVVALVGATTLGTQLLCYAYAGQYYPSAIRSTAVGYASGVGRAGAILAPIGIGILVSMRLPLAQNFVAIAVAGLVSAVAVALIDHRRSASLQAHDEAAEPAA